MENELLKSIQKLISEKEIDKDEVKQAHIDFIKKDLKQLHCIDKYIGDFPTFIEPVHLEGESKLGDDVLVGPNVYIGNNCEIGDYCEIANTIIFENVQLGENFTLQNCIIGPNSKLNFNNFQGFNMVLRGEADSSEELDKVSL